MAFQFGFADEDETETGIAPRQLGAVTAAAPERTVAPAQEHRMEDLVGMHHPG